MEYPLEKEVIQLHVCIQMRQGPNPESCGNSGSMGLLQQLKIEILQNDLDVDVIPSKCLRLCEYGPNVQFVQNGKNSDGRQCLEGRNRALECDCGCNSSQVASRCIDCSGSGSLHDTAVT